MKKRILSCLLALWLVLSGTVCVFAADAPALLAAKKFGVNYADAPSVPAVYGEDMYFVRADTLYRLDAKTLTEEASCALNGDAGYGIVSVTKYDELVFCPLDEGRLDCVNAGTMKVLWSYEDEDGGQCLTHAVCDGERVWAGFWNGERYDAALVCLDALTGETLWRVTHTGGFYRSDPVVDGDYLLIGSDNGSGKEKDPSALYCLDKTTGKTADTLPLTGDCRSTVTQGPDGRYYVPTKGGYLYSFVMRDGKLGDLRAYPLAGEATSEPVFVGGYAVVGDRGSRNGTPGLRCVKTDFTGDVFIPTDGYCQCRPAVLYEKACTRLVFTTNTPAGKLQSVAFDGERFTDAADWFAPEAPMTGYCAWPVIDDGAGTLYYKNDSEYIFVLRPDGLRQAPQTLIDALRAILTRLLRLLRTLS